MQLLILNILIFLSLISCSESSKKQIEINSKTNSEELSDTIPIDSVVQKYQDIPKDYLIGKINPASDSMFVLVPRKYCLLRTEYIHKDVLAPFIAMYEAAAKEGVTLGIVSAMRTFDVQKSLWNQRYYTSDNPAKTAKMVLSYLAMPGTSRHHWGTDVDLMDTKLHFFETEQGKKSYQWLLDNAAFYGFYQVYSAGRNTGYNEEKWHWSYMPVAKEFQIQFKDKIVYSDITGFNGAETAEELNVIDDYVFGIDTTLLK